MRTPRSVALLMVMAAVLGWGIVPVTRGLVAETHPDSAPSPSPWTATANDRPTAPPTVRPPLKSNQVSKRNQGSAATLLGSVCLVHLFARDAESHWTESQRRTVRGRLQAAVGFLTSESRRYGVTVSIHEQVLRDVVCSHSIPTDMFTDPVWIEETARKAGYGSVNSLIETTRNHDSRLQTLLMVHVNKRSTSYNLSYYEGVSPEFYGERVVMYASYASGDPTCAASYAHEILHAFGAGELFFPFDTTRQRYEMAKRWFGNDITFRVDRDLNALSIGDYTAYRIGWEDRLEGRYRMFDD